MNYVYFDMYKYTVEDANKAEGIWWYLFGEKREMYNLLVVILD